MEKNHNHNGRELKTINSYLDHMVALNYNERPVDVMTFLRDDYFLGKSTKNGKAIYPGWNDILIDIFRNDSLYIVVLTGAIGIGKSTIAAYCKSYILYRIMCLKDPWSFFHLAPSGKMAVSFFNLTRSLGDTRGFAKLQTYLMNSPWFKEHGGGIIRGKQDPYMELPLFSWKIASPFSQGFGIVGEDVVLGVMDEVDTPMASEGQKRRIVDAYHAQIRRFESRFVYDEDTISRFFLVASKQDDLSFLETFIEEMKGSGRVFVVDKALWEIKPKMFYTGITFKVQVGDAYIPTKILEKDEIEGAVKSGRKIIDVPKEYRFDFTRDPLGALRDLAGISIRGIRKYKLFPSEKFIEECIDHERKNPFQVETIEIGLEDEIEIISLFDFSKLRVPLGVERFIHMDISFSHDCLGLGMSCISGWEEKEVETEDGSFTTDIKPIIETDFVVRFKAREGDRIPLFRIRKFILDLRSRGIKIAKFTADLKLASEDTTQILTRAKIPCEYVSLDKTIKPYMDFRNLVFEQRWTGIPVKVLFFELKHLEHNRDTNKIDHPDKVTELEYIDTENFRTLVVKGSKDAADAAVGSAYQAILNAKKPLNVKEVVDAIRKRKEEGPKPGLPSDWFIEKPVGEDGSKESILVGEEDKAKVMIEAFRKKRKKKGGMFS